MSSQGGEEGGSGSSNGNYSGGSEPPATQMPDSGVGGNVTALEFGDLTGLTRQEVDTFLRGRGASVKGPTPDGYIGYKFPDKSTVTIRPDGEVVRTPAPRYSPDGKNVNKGRRLDKYGLLMQTRNQFGDQVPATNNTGERVTN